MVFPSCTSRQTPTRPIELGDYRQIPQRVIDCSPLLELAPREYFGRLPNLKLVGRREKEGREVFVLKTTPADRSEKTRDDESRRLAGPTWNESEIWIDARDHSVRRIINRYLDWRYGIDRLQIIKITFGRRIALGGVPGIATEITAVGRKSRRKR